MAEKALGDLRKVVMEFDIDNAEDIARKAVAEGVDPIEAAKALTDAIRDVGDAFGKGDLFYRI